MSDYIERDKAIDAIVQAAVDGRKNFYTILKAIPIADVRPVVRGEWIAEEEYGDLWVCDQCGFASEYNDNFCPNCGADMRGECECTE